MFIGMSIIPSQPEFGPNLTNAGRVIPISGMRLELRFYEKVM